MSGPLEGVVVLSLAEQYPGPYATLLLADLGADVIMVERPGSGDPARAFPDFFSSIARNKRSICLDLKSEHELQRFYRLVEQADVVLEGYAPGTAARLGIGYDRLKELQPRLIYASISGYGQTGPYRSRPGHDISFQAVAGLMHGQTGSGDDTPAAPFGDVSAAMFAAFAIVTALYAREKTKLGTYIDVSMTDALVSWLTPFVAISMNGGTPIDVTQSPAYGSFACADGRVLALSIAHEDHFWRRLCSLLTLPESAELGHAQRVQRRAVLRAEIAARILARDLAYWSKELDAHAIPWAPVNDVTAVTTDPHFVSRGLFVDIPRADGSIERHVRQPVVFSSYSTYVRLPTPGLGEHTDSVIAALGSRKTDS